MAKRDTPTALERRVALLVAIGKSPRDALLEAGYSERSVNSKGTSWILNRPRVKREIQRAKADLTGGTATAIDKQLARLPEMLRVALDTLEQIVTAGDNDTIRFKAVSMIIQLSRTLSHDAGVVGSKDDGVATKLADILGKVNQGAGSNG